MGKEQSARVDVRGAGLLLLCVFFLSLLWREEEDGERGRNLIWLC